ncbi:MULTISPECIES: prolyl oligopeptidase family serine peptidase [unclassified Pseudoalteromonas]|uniref:prolyl oligopeptidase family serine peptidase n=2 Tax=Bacteria TaxID=2 RepID=UPI0025B2D420|nr:MULTISPECIES: prolyl oligopeptidase family serine peptidase [unclassified Pseudoalteromonas]MDN3377566.1 prolyl oligopeptidase family serine peptidase [Pseudoalteromonas sp. APC 3893]MDN3385267.1 prolyl oligopeptidase family serine peptidase [Pseudoalteromonas sp. APC 4017]
MLKKVLACAVIAALSGCSDMPVNKSEKEVITKNETTQQLTYPETKKGAVVDIYFDEKVADPYRWLEDDMSDETAHWVETQNNTTFSYLDTIPYRDTLKASLEKLMNYEKVTAPFIEGKYTYFYKNDGLQNQYVLFRKLGDGEAEVFLDPNTFSDDGTTSMSGLTFSEDGSLAAYQISEGGSDWRKIIIINTGTKQPVEENLVDVKFSGISWLANEGFYYSSYDKPKGSELSAKTDQHKVYFHKLGTAQSSDELVYGGTDDEKHRYVGASVTRDNRYLLISASVSTSGNKLFIKDLSKPDSQLTTILEHTESDTYLLDNDESKLFLVTNLNAPNKKVVTVDATNPTPDHWQDLIAETDNVLSMSKGGDYFFAKYMVDAISKVQQFDKSGELVREISLPGVGTARGFSGKKQSDTLYYSFANYTTPGNTYAFNVKTGASDVYRKSGAQFDSEQYTSEQVFYSSKDGTKVPMIISYKKDTKLDGKNPTILYGYGGFNASMTPGFSSTIAAWLEQGGVYAVANIRGGGEYGKAWHDAGTQLKKQNVFDDFIAAAEYLNDKKYTSSDYLAVRGGSNGGLLVGAVMTQRPELFKVALPAVGVLDMLRYHTFTAGAGWAYDYGTSEQSKEMFDYLKAYSPVHNVKQGVEYPATLITTGDHDDRVVPAHSYKFAAELQTKGAGVNPYLIRIETNAGHGAGTPTSKIIDQYADIYGFTLYNMGIKSL